MERDGDAGRGVVAAREVPSAYATDALKKAAGELAKGAYPEAADPVAELEVAVARGDRGEARRLLDGLAR